MRKQLLTIALVAGYAITASAQSGTISTIAGLPGKNGFNGDGTAIRATLNFPGGISLDTSGNLYIADYQNSLVRKINKAGLMTTVAGNGIYGFSGDGGPATDASLSYPTGVHVDIAGNIYIAEPGNNVIRKVDAAGIIRTIAGINSFGYNGDGIDATAAKLAVPFDVTADAAGNVYIADAGNNRIRKINPAGIISTVAGDSARGYSGDGGMATDAALTFPCSVALDAAGHVYFVDSNRIRKVSATGTISTVAGSGASGNSGDGAAATAATMNFPIALSIDDTGNIYVADQNNGRVRKIDTSGIIKLVAGNGTFGYSGDGGNAAAAAFRFPTGVAVDTRGSVYIADNENFLIREVVYAHDPQSVQQAAITDGSMTVSPNPGYDHITITLPRGQQGAAIAIYNSAGQRVMNFVANHATTETDISGLSEGVYFVIGAAAANQWHSTFTKLR